MEGRNIREIEVGDYFEAVGGGLLKIAEIVYHDKKGNSFKPEEWEPKCLPWNWTITSESGQIVDMWGVSRYHKRGDIEANEVEFEPNHHITDYWLEHYIHKDSSLCSLCGNTGIIDTTKTAVSPAGIKTGKKNWCICPNGQHLRNRAERA